MHRNKRDRRKGKKKEEENGPAVKVNPPGAKKVRKKRKRPLLSVSTVFASELEYLNFSKRNARSTASKLTTALLVQVDWTAISRSDDCTRISKVGEFGRIELEIVIGL